MSQFINLINDQNAQELLGGTTYNPPSYPYPSYPKHSWSVKQSVYAPIKSVAVSSSDATAFNIGVKNLFSPQIATATAISGATSTVIGGTVSA
ncbi:hypothetical protein [Synechococcus elongatus]|uniref:hypothetical protein n=1 Tax=Synechococcus elongatus TaxID=32046 RepID=UPI000F7ED3A9|nr:hypothetical protein [Synechococcus elongatus]MBD2587568.1 hypothetical protein [Synechococcus elongatus FACHB-242]MBD2688653.1 hypothetical protein [Synechococcus elongatus FACHB-1061]MBD2707724.1 hypothetical protein [Synechococcus elongatus PCC 7942 = FACHB-805]UOW70945.1 Ebf3 [Synechococcus elongatus PCC 7943]UOW73666.1 Ebf3 [Synechococcus elongatus PCC 6311]